MEVSNSLQTQHVAAQWAIEALQVVGVEVANAREEYEGWVWDMGERAYHPVAAAAEDLGVCTNLRSLCPVHMGS
jgi:hypothetical protein